MNYDRWNAHELVEVLVNAGNGGIEENDPEIVIIESALRKAVIRDAQARVCEWKENEDGMWDTSCEEIFVFDEDGPEENGQKFCCYCGKPLKAIPFVYPTEEETP